MKLTKNQLNTIVSTICNNESTRIRDEIKAQENSKEVQSLVKHARAEFERVSDVAWRLAQGDSCTSGKHIPSDETLTKGAMRELGLHRDRWYWYLPSGFREQIELKVQMCFIDAKDLKDLEKRVGYKFVIV